MVTKADDELLQVAVKIEFHDVCGLFLLVARRRYNLKLIQWRDNKNVLPGVLYASVSMTMSTTYSSISVYRAMIKRKPPTISYNH